METVLVFKTSVRKTQEVEKLRPILNGLMNRDERWNFDLEDCDRILRVESRKLSAGIISTVLKTEGYSCEELED